MTGARPLRVLALALLGCQTLPPARAAEASAGSRTAKEPPAKAPSPVPPDPAPTTEPDAAGPTKAPRAASRGKEEAALHREFDGAKALRVARGEAAYYGDRFAGHKTANGERYDPQAFTAAHRTFSFGTIVRVRRADTGSYTYVRVTDRGPFGSKTRVIDLSKIAARRLDMLRRGVVEVRLEVVRWGDSKRSR